MIKIVDGHRPLYGDKVSIDNFTLLLGNHFHSQCVEI